MTHVPFIPENAPFNIEQRAWLNGFLAGMLSQGTAAAATPGVAKKPLLVLFGSQSGNAESFAKKLAKEANGRGFNARAASMEAMQAAELTKERNLLVITSTWGEGDMPDNAAAFWDGLNNNGSSPKLDGVNFSVLALGDTNYADTFCLAGKKFDQRLEELGARRIHSRVDCDVDFEAPAKTWSEGVWAALDVASSEAFAPGNEAKAGAVATTEPKTEAGYSRKNPFPARLLNNRKLNTDGSAKDTRHIEFSLTDSGLHYEVGDALGVCVQNCPEVVASIIAAHGLDANALTPLPDGGEAPLSEALTKHYEVRTLLGQTLEQPISPEELVGSLRRLTPRLYSIASSLTAHPEEVHLCVAAVRYELDGTAHKGVASTFLADRLPLGEPAGVFIQHAKHFGVPADGNVPIIMVGPGTGIAPFRAFLEERHATGAKGKNWLLFGDQCAATDFLYREQIQAWSDDGFLTRLDLAFSRDQKEKIYVQHRMTEHTAEFWKWLEEGAHFYVCGDANRMAKDVDAALHQVIEHGGQMSAEAAAAYVAEMKKSKRYARDVY